MKVAAFIEELLGCLPVIFHIFKGLDIYYQREGDGSKFLKYLKFFIDLLPPGFRGFSHTDLGLLPLGSYNFSSNVGWVLD